MNLQEDALVALIDIKNELTRDVPKNIKGHLECSDNFCNYYGKWHDDRCKKNEAKIFLAGIRVKIKELENDKRAKKACGL